MVILKFMFIVGSLLLWASGAMGIIYGLYQWGPGGQRFGMAVWRGLMVWAGTILLGGVLFLIGMVGTQ